MKVKIEQKLTERSRSDLLSKAVLASDTEVNSVGGGRAAVGHLVLSEIGTISFEAEKGGGGCKQAQQARRHASRLPGGSYHSYYTRCTDRCLRITAAMSRITGTISADLSEDWCRMMPFRKTASARLGLSRMLAMMANDINLLFQRCLGPRTASDSGTTWAADRGRRQ